MTDRSGNDGDGTEVTATEGTQASMRPGSKDLADLPLVPREGFFEGQIAILGRTLVEGTVRGSLRGAGELIIGPEARIEGVVECDVVSSRGVIVGPVTARSRAHFSDGAHFEGDLDSPTVSIDGDAVWTGVARVGS